SESGVLTGFLFKKGERNTAYHRRWFILKGNMLFYFEERESREPIGVIVLEGCTVELCESESEEMSYCCPHQNPPTYLFWTAFA
uniref:PH domain-containing protein n=1 Tax=Cyprinus carpio TaxID=7962 RepID=A0A8C1MJS3_CYPCA